MLHILKAAVRKRHHLGGVHICTTLVPSRVEDLPVPILAGITDALLLPGESFDQPAPPPAARTVLTFVLEGNAERSSPSLQPAPYRLPEGSIQIEPLATGGSAAAGADRWHNPSSDEVSHLLRFWITRCGSLPQTLMQAAAPVPAQHLNVPRLLACPEGSPNHLRCPQGMAWWHATLHHGQRWRRALRAGHHAWVNVTSGEVWCCGKLLAAGDAALAHGEPCLRLQARRPAQLFVLEFDV